MVKVSQKPVAEENTRLDLDEQIHGWLAWFINLIKVCREEKSVKAVMKFSHLLSL